MSHVLPLPEQLKALEHLQELDLKIFNIQNRVQDLPTKLRTLETSFQQINAQLTEKNTEFEQIEKNHRQFAAAIELNNERSQRAAKKLEQVTNSNEFQAANKEIEQLKKLNENLEAQKAKTDEAMAAIKKDLDQLNEQAKKLQEELNEEEKRVSGERAVFGNDLDSLEDKRKTAIVGIDVQTLSRYDRIRKARNGLGLVPVVSGQCKGCNMMVPHQLINEIRRYREVVQCSSCHRIIYVPSGENGKAAP